MPEGKPFDISTAEVESGFFRKISRKNRWVIGVITLIFLAFVGYFYFQRIMTSELGSQGGVPASDIAVSEPSRTERPPLADADTASIDPIPLFGDANYRSENFRVGDIAIGGEAEFLLTEDSPEPVTISAIRGEAFAEKNKQQVKLVLSWKTNKLAKSEVIYSKGVGQAKKFVSEDDHSIGHSVIIPDIDQASTYVYTIVSRDRFGNEAVSDPHAVYTGSRTVSLFDLIADAVGDVFGWAVKKE